MRVAFFSLAATLVGCATAPPQFNYQPVAQVVSTPAVNETRQARVGDELLRQGRFVVRDTIYVPAALQVSAYRLSPGSFKKVGEGPEGDFFLPAGGPDTGALAPIGGIVDPPQAVLVKREGGILCVVTVYNISTCSRPTAQVTFPSSEGFERRRTQEAISGQALLYLGRSGSSIRLAHRDLGNPAAAPVPVEYDLTASPVIAYRGAHIEVLEATPTSIRYRVLQPFSGAAS